MFISKKSILEKNLGLIKELAKSGKNKEEILQEIGLDASCKSTLKIFLTKHKIFMVALKSREYIVLEKNKKRIVEMILLDFKYTQILRLLKLEENLSNYNKLLYFLNQNSISKKSVLIGKKAAYKNKKTDEDLNNFNTKKPTDIQ